MLALTAACLAAYLLGCASPAYLAARWRLGRDIRTLGSGNAGARNAARVLGPRLGAAVLLADLAKGALAVALARRLGVDGPGQVLAVTAAVAGHVWPAQLGFRGGKGLAAGFGAVAWLSPALAVALCAAGLPLGLACRSATAGCLLAAAATPAVAWAVGLPPVPAALLALPCGLVVLAHRDNVRALVGRRRAGGPP